MAFARSALMAAAKSAVASTASSTTVKTAAKKTATKTTAKKTAAKKTAAKKAAAKTTANETPKIPRGILKPVPVSPSLGEFIGASEASRTEAVKKVWEHIKLNNLQNPTNKKLIYCDDKLKTIFEGKEEVGFLEIAKLLSKHFVKKD